MTLDIANVGLLLTLVGCVVGFLTYNLAKKKEDKQEIKEDSSTQARLEIQLEYILKGINDIKEEMREIKTDAKCTKEEQDKKIADVMSEIVRMSESLKSAHKREDELERSLNESIKRINELEKGRNV